MKRKKRMGRPPLPKAERRSVKVSFRATAALHEAVVKAAEREGKSVGQYITDVLVDAVKGDK